jgi:mono/diheme cytochrome c family protein
MNRLTISLAAVLLAACAEPTQTESILDLTGDHAAGKAIYEAPTGCSLCHGLAGEGVEGLGVALAGTSLSAEEIIMTVLTGNDQGMGSAETYQLSDQDVADVTAHVLEL